MDTFLSNVKPEDKSFCQTNRRLPGKGYQILLQLIVNNTKITSVSHKAELLVNSFIQLNNISSKYQYLHNIINEKVSNLRKW